MGVEVLAEGRVQLLVVVGGWVGGGWEKKQINAILNSIEVKVEVGVELGKSEQYSFIIILYDDIVCESNA